MKFNEHALAHQWLDGLRGLEIGAAAHNPFGLLTRNVAPQELHEYFASNQAKFDVAPAVVDIWGLADAIPVPDESEDFILSSHVVEHLPDVIGAFLEWNRIVRVQGYIFMIVPLRNALPQDVGRPITPLDDFIDDYFKGETLATHPVEGVPGGRMGHYHVFTPDSLVELVAWMNKRRLCDWRLVAREDVDTKVGNGFTLVFQIESKPAAGCSRSNSAPAAAASSDGNPMPRSATGREVFLAELHAVRDDLAATRSKFEEISRQLEIMKEQFDATRLQNFRMQRSLAAANLENYKMQRSWVWLPLKPFRCLEKAVRKRRKQLLAKWFPNGQNHAENHSAAVGDGRRFADASGPDYQMWVRLYDTLTSDDARRIREHIAKLTRQPLVSVLMPVYNTPEIFLRQAIESVRTQLYERWELCIADDASSEPHVRKILQDYQKLDPRIKVTFRNENGHISRASNSALELAEGEFVALLDHDDELAPHALYALANELSRHPDADIIYSDYDQLNEKGERESPYFKTDWNPDLLLSHNYICHLAAYRTERVRQVGGFRTGFEGSQDWDLSLRVSEQTTAERIRHIPRILYHWRRHPQSTSVAHDSKPYAAVAAARAVQDHLTRKNRSARVIETQFRGWSRVRYEIEEPPLVSIIICTRDRFDLLGPCVTSILTRTRYPRFEVLIVDNNSRQRETLDYFDRLKKAANVRILKDPQPFNYSAINNTAVSSARGDVLCFMNNDTEVISADWLYEMVSHAMREEIGAVGAKLLYPDNCIQHAGVVLGIGGVADHVFCGMSADAPGYMGRAQLIQNYTALTGACLVLRRTVFEEVGGFNPNELKVAFSDIDLCLKIHAAGYHNLWTPYAVLYHHESSSRGTDDTAAKAERAAQEIAYMSERWKGLLQNDPAYNPNLALNHAHFDLAFPPRVLKPWLAA